MKFIEIMGLTPKVADPVLGIDTNKILSIANAIDVFFVCRGGRIN